MMARYRRHIRLSSRDRRNAGIVAAAGAFVLIGAHAGGGGGAAPAQAAVASGNVALGQQMAASEYGWTGGQWNCLDWLWTRESGWSATATNQQSGAYGIPQSLPAAKMAAAGADWQTDPATQIRWGLSYIVETYSTPCGAWAHEETNGWY
jgi:resuscitation-promoting factor RpfB